MTKKVNKFIQQKVKILAVKKLTEDVIEIVMEKPTGLSHKPGQFAGVKIDDGKKEPGFRSYSILEDGNGNLQLVIKLVEGGRGSTFLFSRKPGEELEILYPLGYFGFPEKLTDHQVFIATGTGIVPVLCMLETFPENYQHKVDLFFGLRYAGDVFYEDRIAKLKNKISYLNFVITLSKPDETWKGLRGRVTAHLKDIDPVAQYYMCGSGAMIEEVRKMLAEASVQPENIYFEDFNT